MRKSLAAWIASLLLYAGAAGGQTGMGAVAPAGSLTLGAEALVWWMKSSPTPVPIITDGLYGRAGTNVLLGGGDADTNPNPGLRVSAGYVVDPLWGIEGNFLYIGERSTSNGVESSGQHGSTDLLVPFFDVTGNRENVTEISFSPVYKGSATTEFTNSMMGAELNAVRAMPSDKPWDVRLIGGFRWLQLEESYTITTSSSFIPPIPADVWITTDRFDATNNFYGAQFGGRARYQSDPWFATGVLKVGLGAMVQKVDVSGSLVTNDFGASGANQTFPGGYFALPTNIGNYSRTVFAVVPEVQLNVGLRITPSVSIVAGYSFLYASDVARPGKQINRNINPTQSVSYVGEPPATRAGPAQPDFSFDSSDFWAQGVSLGIDVRF